jgi:hypothetical protein
LLAGDTFGWSIASRDGIFGRGTLTVSNVSWAGPTAPAPLAGAGLLSAFAALAALAMTRLLGRKDQLA